MNYKIRFSGPTPRQVSRWTIAVRRIWRDYNVPILLAVMILVLVLALLRFYPSPTLALGF